MVREALKIMDPNGVSQRRQRRLERRTYRSPGPNAAWHIDGYDKLAPYGFHISGCIDGYSRRIMFLQVAATNHDPSVIANYYLSCVKQIKGCPRVVQTDCGTDNVVLAAIQGVFCRMQVIHIQGLTAIDMVAHQLTSASKRGGLITEKTTANGGLICSKT